MTEVQKSSCGALLRGTLRKADIEDSKELMCRRRKLVQFSKYADVYGTDLPQTYGYSRFDSSQEYTDFQQSVRNKETSVRGGLDISACFASIGIGAAKTKTKSKDSFHMTLNRHVYKTQIVYQVIPVASFQFDKSKLELSDEARAGLKTFCSLIWKSYENERKGTHTTDVNKKEKYKECAKFFETFGSHINVSVYHLGGILTWKSTFCSNTDSHSNEINSLVASSLQAHVKAGFTGFGVGAGIDISASRYKSEIESNGNFNTTDIASTMLSCDVYGGPPASTSFEDWRKSLTPECPNLVIIDRGDLSNQDHIAAWHILNQDPWFLEDDCTTQTNKWGNINREERAKLRQNISVSMSENFNTWIYRKKIGIILSNAGETPSSEEYIKGLLKIEAENKRHENGGPKWLEFLQDDQNITEFLMKPPNLKYISRSGFAKIQAIIKRLLEDVKDNDFQHKDDVLKVISKSSDIESRIIVR